MAEKKFEPFPVRAIRMSDATWNKLKKSKALSGKSWNLYLMGLIETKRNKK